MNCKLQAKRRNIFSIPPKAAAIQALVEYGPIHLTFRPNYFMYLISYM